MGASQVIDVEQYDVICVSPRNFFMFTPMLPSTAVGTVEFRWADGPVEAGRGGCWGFNTCLLGFGSWAQPPCYAAVTRLV